MVRPYRGFCHNGKMIQKSMPITANSVSVDMVATEYMHRSIQCTCISTDSFKVWISSSVRLLWPNYLSSSSSSSSSSLVQYLKSSSYFLQSWQFFWCLSNQEAEWLANYPSDLHYINFGYDFQLFYKNCFLKKHSL